MFQKVLFCHLDLALISAAVQLHIRVPHDVLQVSVTLWWIVVPAVALRALLVVGHDLVVTRFADLVTVRAEEDIASRN